jgi:uncharacterized protein (TIGR00266 family)
METQIHGTVLPVLELTLHPGEKIVSEAGEMSWMSQTIQMLTTTQTAGAKGVMGVLKRAVAGGGIFMTEFTAESAPGQVAFATKMPGEILDVQVQPGSELMIQRSGFLCATEGVELTIGFQKKLGAGIFGGEGFILQKLGGSCQAWVELDGEVRIIDLQPGEVLRVNPGHVGMFQAQMAFDVQMVPGIKNKLFGGEGLFLATLTGPGRVWLQTLPIANLAHSLMPYLPSATNGDGDSMSVTGTIGNLLGGN